MSIKASDESKGIPVLMIHGMVEDGRIFYHHSGKGLGSYLAKHGYDVYVADLRGLGKSTPKIHRNSEHGQTETIVTDIPALINFVLEQTQHPQLHLVAHSWGGVNINASLLRFPKLADKVISASYFGSKRRIRTKNFERFFKVDIFWNRLGLVISHKKGFLPAKALKVGSENETLKTHIQCVEWVKKDEWIDSDDNFNYNEAAKNNNLPATLYIAAIKDRALGHKDDVKLFMDESKNNRCKYLFLSKKLGNALDYNHINMLTAPEAIKDHFPKVLKWMHSHEK